MPKGPQSVSKFLSFVLRHAPESVGLSLDEAGWVPVTALLDALGKHGKPLDRAGLEQLVRESDKQRFALSADGQLIRASQGHSVEVALGYTHSAPPTLLFHGSVARFLPSIRTHGLVKGNRHHVHLSPTRELALLVGGRRGKPLVIEVAASMMAAEGYEFFCAANGVWLTEHVPARFLLLPASAD